MATKKERTIEFVIDYDENKDGLYVIIERLESYQGKRNHRTATAYNRDTVLEITTIDAQSCDGQEWDKITETSYPTIDAAIKVVEDTFGTWANPLTKLS